MNKVFVVEKENVGERLDVFLLAKFPDFSRSHIKNLIESKRKSNQVVTKFSLKKETNKTGITYSKVILSFDRDLTDAEKENISKMSEQTKSIARNLHENEVEE